MQLHVGRMYHWKIAAKHIFSGFMTRQHIVLKTEGWLNGDQVHDVPIILHGKMKYMYRFETPSIAKYMVSK